MTMPVAVGACLTVLFATGFAASAYVVAAVVTAGARPAVRFAGFSVGVLAIPLTVFELLYFTHAFRWELVGGAALAVGLAALSRLGPGGSLRAVLDVDLRALGDLSVAFRASGWRGAIVVLTAPLLALHVARGIGSPPIAWDALTYHLPRAAMWVQSHGPYAYDAAGAWSYYTHFPILGDGISSLAMVTPRSDVLVGATWVAIWALFGATTLALATTLGAPPGSAVLAAVATSLVPCVLVHMATAYVDTAAALLVVAAAVLLLDFEERHAAGSGGLALGAFALAIAIRTTALPLAAGGLAAWALTARGARPAAGRSLAIGALMTAVLLLPHLVIALHEFGSPLYPFGLTLFGKPVWRWEGELEWFFGSRPILSVPTYLRRTFLVGIAGSPVLQNNLGVPGLLLLAGAAATAVRERARFSRTALLTLATGLAGVLALVMGARDMFEDDLRYMSAVPAVCAAFLAASRRPAGGVLLALATLAGLAFAYPFRFGHADLSLAYFVLVLLAVCGALAALSVALVARRAARGSPWRVLAVLPAALALSGLVEPVRAPLAAAIRRDAAFGAAFTSGPLTFAASSGAIVLADLVDDPARPRRIAVAIGWDYCGHNGFVYPFLGSRLENTLEFVSPLADGSITSPRLLPRAPSRADYAAFRAEIVRRRIDAVVTLGPPPFESRFFDRHPEDFQLVKRVWSPGNALYRVTLH